MPQFHREWTVLPHDPLERLAPSVWRVSAGLEGAPMKRVMSVLKRADGQLVVHSGIALAPAQMQALEAEGPVGFILVPNGFHRLDAFAFKQRYPNAKVLCPAGSRKKVEAVVAVDGSYADFPPDPRVSLEHCEGTAEQEGLALVKDPGELTLVLNDLVFNMPHGAGLAGFILRHLTASSGGPKISRISRLFLVKDKAKVRGALERLAALPDLKRVIVSHHQVIDSDPAATLRRVAASL
ncbi:MAG: hypothetical protein U1E65_23860 [Myxococcota bacterium]